LFLFVVPASAYTWEKTFGGTFGESGRCVQQTADGGYIIVGDTSSFGAGDNDVYLIKTDNKGNMVWEKTFGGSSLDVGYFVQQTADGGYIIVGRTHSFGAGDNDVYLLKTDDEGNKVWEKTFGGSGDDQGYCVRQLTDGGYIIVGRTDSFGAGRSDAYLFKTDDKGDKVWEKTFGGSLYDVGYSVQQTADGGYIIAWSRSGDVYLLKTDDKGDKVWEQRIWAGAGIFFGDSVQQTTDGGYVYVGDISSSSADSDVYLLKTEDEGNKVWEQTFGGSGNDVASSVQQTADGGYIIVGRTHSFGAGDNDVYLLKTDDEGNKVWEQTFGGSGDDEGYSVQQTTDDGYIIAGMTKSFGAGESDVYLIYYAPFGDFNASPTSGPVPLTVYFEDLSTSATSWLWDFGDGSTSTKQNPSHTYIDAGEYTVSLTVEGSLGSATNTKRLITVYELLEVRVSASSDDAEERTWGKVYRQSTDLEMVYDTDFVSNEAIGIRFNDVDIPPQAHIENAYIQFQTAEVSTGAASFTVEGQDIDNAPTFSSSNWDITSRARTDSQVPWSPLNWNTVGESSTAQRTPDLSSIIQEITGRAGWSSGNSLVIIITGTGHRVATSYDGNPNGAPVLNVEYYIPDVLYVDGQSGTDPTDCYGGKSWSSAFRSCQKAIDCAWAGDEIWVKKGTYALTSTINVNKPVHIYGGFAGNETQRDQRNWENNVTTVDGQSLVRCFHVNADATIDGFTITRGKLGEEIGGGGILVEDSKASIVNCNLTAHEEVIESGLGGAIYNSQSSLTITNCNFSQNQAWRGGAIFNNSYSSAVITKCTFTDNEAEHEGAIYNGTGTTSTITDCVFSNNGGANGAGTITNSLNSVVIIDKCSFLNNGGDWGGAISNGTESDVTISNCTFNGNGANWGGAISNWGCSPIIINSTFSKNSAERGSAINNENSSPKITNCTFSDNKTWGGAVIANEDSSPIITNCTFFGNDGSDNGGGSTISASNSSPKITNCILWGNLVDQVTCPQLMYHL
jgi:PKD repeat protein